MKLRKNRKLKVTPNVDLTPLIDVVFQLLIFFMLSATFVVQSTINIDMPEAKGTTEIEEKDLSITLAYGDGGPDGKGPVYLDDNEVLSMAELEQILAQRYNENPDLRLLVRPDERIEVGRYVEVLGIARSVGIRNLGIVARPADDDE